MDPVNKEESSQCTCWGGQPDHRGPCRPIQGHLPSALSVSLRMSFSHDLQETNILSFGLKMSLFHPQSLIFKMLLTDFTMSLIFRNSNKLSKLNCPSRHTDSRRYAEGSFSPVRAPVGVSLAACFLVANDPFPFQILLLLAKGLLPSFLLYRSLPARVSFTSSLL